MTAQLSVVEGQTARLQTPILPDPTIILRAQEYVQLALGSMLEAQGYRGDETLGQLLDAWLSSCQRLATSTQTGYRYNASAFVRELARIFSGGIRRLQEVHSDDELEAMGRALPVAQLRLEHVEKAIDKMAAGRWNSVTTCLRACFRWANGHGFAGVSLLRPSSRRHKAQPLALPRGAWARAAHCLYDAFEKAAPRSRATAAAALCSVRWGVRRGAVARLEHSAIVGNQVTLTDKGRARIVVLDELDLSILASLPRRGQFVFPGRGKVEHVNPNSVTAHTRRVLRPAGLQLTLHQAGRHAAGAAILEGGGSTGDAAVHLGHANDRITRERYLPAVTDASRARAVLRAAWDQVTPSSAGQRTKRDL